MKGTIIKHANERQLRPSVNAPISAFYRPGDNVEIVETLFGDPFEGDDLWYKLNNGGYVWNGAVEAEVDCSKLIQEDKQQWLISYRENDRHMRPKLFSRKAPDSLFFTSVTVPVSDESIRVTKLVPKEFTDLVMRSVNRVANERKHVFVYIHGYQLPPSLKLDLLAQFTRNYMKHPANTIAKVLFMTWPALGFRKKADDRAIEHGENFTEKNMFQVFNELSDALKAEGRFLNLVVHSFGHQLLNGMLNHSNNFPTLARPIFENIFLMAPDVTHLAVQTNGIDLENAFEDSDDSEVFHYEYTNLKILGKHVHIFHDKQDYLLYVSTRKFVRKRDIDNPVVTKKYRNLGNYGAAEIPPADLEPGFKFYNVLTLPTSVPPGDLSDFPFQKMDNSPFLKEMQKVLDNNDYGEIRSGKVLLNQKVLENHHRYIFTYKSVVEKVLELLG